MKKFKTTDGIAPWKIDSKKERILAAKADTSWRWRKKYVKYYEKHDPEYFKKGLKFIYKYIKSFKGDVSNEKKDFYIVDMVYSLHRFGCMFDEYFMYNYEVLNTKGRESFITDKLRWSYYAKMNTNKANEIFNDKKRTYEHFCKYYKRDLVNINGVEDKVIFENFIKKHNSFIVKPCNSSGGRGIFKVDLKSITPDKCFEDILKIGEVVLEELIIQSKEMQIIHPSSVNTLRLPTIRDKDGVHIFHPVLRVGMGGSVVDNAAQGGLFASVDPDTGIVYTKATDEFGAYFVKHPDTGVSFPGFQIPDWEQAIQLVNELAYVIEENHYVGWDFAHTENGWVMVEGNPRAQPIVAQVFFQEGFKDEVEKYISRM